MAEPFGIYHKQSGGGPEGVDVNFASEPMITLFQAEGTDISRETATIGIRRADRDNDGKLNKKEFVQLMTSNSKK